MNKRGDISTILIFVVALVLCIYALFVFASINDSFESQSQSHADFMREIDFAQDYVTASAELIGRQAITCKDCTGNLKEIFMSSAAKRDVSYSGSGNFYAKIRNEEFAIERKVGGYTLTMNELFVISERGVNRVKRNFDLQIEFDSDGKVLEKKITADLHS